MSGSYDPSLLAVFVFGTRSWGHYYLKFNSYFFSGAFKNATKR